MISGVVFDFDGTLADTFPGILDGWKETFKILNIGEPDPVVVKRAIGPTKDTYLRMILGDNYEAHQERALSVFKDIYRGHCINKTVLFPGIAELLQTLKTRGIKIAIASNKPYSQIISLVEMLDIRDLFDPVLGPEKVKEGKPAPDMFLACADHFGLAPALVAVVGDTPLDLLAGSRAGMMRIGVLWGYTTRAELEAHTPDALVQTPSEITALLG